MHFTSTANVSSVHIINESKSSESKSEDMATSETKVLTLSEEEFNEYKTKGYFRGIKYRWTSQDGTYTVYISKSSYDKLRQNMESGPTGLAKILDILTAIVA